MILKNNKMNLSEAIAKAENILVIGHFNPDGDAVGATMALKYFLNNMGKEATAIFPNRYSFNLSWMDPDNKAVFYNEKEEIGKSLIAKADMIFCLDFQSQSRTDTMAEILKEKKAFKVLVDHHINPSTEEFDLCFSEIAVSSTCEKLYKTMVSELDTKHIDKRVASCLYAGICTDTGSFSFSCGHADLFLIIAELIRKGADTVQIHRVIFDTFSPSRMRLLGYCLNSRLVVMEAYKTAYMSLGNKDLEEFNYQSGDLEGVVNYALGMENILFAAFFTQSQTKIRISLRSKGDIDVNVFAGKHFGGGGHKNAAGGTSMDSLQSTLEKFEDLVPDFYESEIKKGIRTINVF